MQDHCSYKRQRSSESAVTSICPALPRSRSPSTSCRCCAIDKTHAKHYYITAVWYDGARAHPTVTAHTANLVSPKSKHFRSFLARNSRRNSAYSSANIGVDRVEATAASPPPTVENTRGGKPQDMFVPCTPAPLFNETVTRSAVFRSKCTINYLAAMLRPDILGELKPP